MEHKLLKKIFSKMVSEIFNSYSNFGTRVTGDCKAWRVEGYFFIEKGIKIVSNEYCAMLAFLLKR